MITHLTKTMGGRVTITLLLLLLTLFKAYAQDDPEPEKLRQLIRSSDYIFEGKVVPATYEEYSSPDSTQHYSSILVDISKVIQGDLMPGTIELVTKKKYRTYFIDNGVRRGYIISHPPKINGFPIRFGSDNYIFFAKSTQLPPDPQPKEVAIDNPQKVDVEEGLYGMIELESAYTHYPEGPFNTEFGTEKEIYDLMKDVGVAVPEDIHNNARDYNVYERKREEAERQLKASRAGERKRTTEEKIQMEINGLKAMIKVRKAAGYPDDDERMIMFQKELKKWQKKMERYKKKH